MDQGPSDGPFKTFTAHMLRLYDLKPADVRDSPQFRAWVNLPVENRDELLSAIPTTTSPSYRPLHLLYTLLTECHGPWPPSLLRHYARILRALPSTTSRFSEGDSTWLAHQTECYVKKASCSPLGLLHDNDQPAIRFLSPNQCISHSQLSKVVKSFVLPAYPQPCHDKPVVAIHLLPGRLLAVALFAATAYYTVVVIPSALSTDEKKSCLSHSNASYVITDEDGLEELHGISPWLHANNIQAWQIELDDLTCLTFKELSGKRITNKGLSPPDPNKPDDVALLSITQGIWGSRGVVPRTLHDLLRSAFMAIDAWELRSSDVCFGLDSFSDGGEALARTLFAPILSGGSVISPPLLDGGAFWHSIHEMCPTWYAAPYDVHQAILAEAPYHDNALEEHPIRLACNTSQDALPQTIISMIRDTFNCPVSINSDALELSEPMQPMSHANKVKTEVVTYSDPKRPSLPHIRASFVSARRKGSAATEPECSAGNQQKTRSKSLGDVLATLTPTKDGTIDFLGDDGYLKLMRDANDSIHRKKSLIDPHRVEQAIIKAAKSPGSSIYGRVSQAMVFGVDHETLGQDTALIIVPSSDTTRIDLRTLHTALQQTPLPKFEWPNLIIYMNDIPRRKGQALRVKLSTRLGLPQMKEESSHQEKHWEAKCPLPDTPLTEPIECSQCNIDLDSVNHTLSSVTPAFVQYHIRAMEDGTYELYLAPAHPDMSELPHDCARRIERLMSVTMHDYLLPTKFHLLSGQLPISESGRVDDDGITSMMARMKQIPSSDPVRPTKDRVIEGFAQALGIHEDHVDQDVGFFEQNGDHEKAEVLICHLRNELNIDIPSSILAGQGTVESISSYIDNLMRREQAVDTMEGCTETRSSTRPWLMGVQLLPLVLFFPMRSALQWISQLWILSRTRFWEDNESLFGRLSNLCLSMAASWAFIQFLSPFIGILSKWVVMGRFYEGLYPMWGAYHTRYWLTQKLVCLCGRGCFDFNNRTKSWYYRLMGAKIGKGVKFSGESLGEWDLLDIRDGASLNHCLCRPFAAEGNTSMYLGKIIIGENATVGALSVVAPGTEVMANTNIGINSSSWEQDDAEDIQKDIGLQKSIPDPHWILNMLLTWPLWTTVWIFSLLPWLGGLAGMTFQAPVPSERPLRVIINWFQGNPGVAYHYLAVMLHASLNGVIFFGVTVTVRKALDLMLGNEWKEAKEAKRIGGHFRVWRATLMRTLFSEGYLQELNELIGLNHSVRSAVLRHLGANIGERVCWPMKGPWITDYHLLDVGNDVTFGSECHLIASDDNDSGMITLKDGVVVSDHVCVLPGVTIGERSTLGFGALTRRGKTYDSDTNFVGCRRGDVVSLPKGEYGTSLDVPQPTFGRHQRQDSDTTLVDEDPNSPKFGLDKEDACASAANGVNQESSSSSPKELLNSEIDSPFRRAFYQKQAPYKVWSPGTQLAFSAFMTLFTAFYWNVPAMSGMKMSARVFYDYCRHLDSSVDVFVLYPLTVIAMSLLHSACAALAIGVVIASKWWILGRHEPGNYDWDKSSYCQRRQLVLAIEKIIHRCYVDKGILSLLTGTEWLVMYYRAMGAHIGKNCCLFANGYPSLMLTEPDLITIGDRVAIDDVGIISHIDDRGKFSLDKVEIGNRCVLRSGSSVLSGAMMRDDSCLLEHTLVMPGEIIEEKWVMQRRPAERFYSKRIKKTKTDEES